ncbi:hypothetical protein NDU88_004521 [Pleurodeles waltl]|uniref:Uncharacterized protein n=1 Tax=Pleurodeles waltl TaxID=8319 RepID=A0AAV7T862_PLEWA|nr:hypothetical protein NDU88_004521 [Pleurodeles waltl]
MQLHVTCQCRSLVGVRTSPSNRHRSSLDCTRSSSRVLHEPTVETRSLGVVFSSPEACVQLTVAYVQLVFSSPGACVQFTYGLCSAHLGLVFSSPEAYVQLTGSCVYLT